MMDSVLVHLPWIIGTGVTVLLTLNSWKKVKHSAKYLKQYGNLFTCSVDYWIKSGGGGPHFYLFLLGMSGTKSRNGGLKNWFL